MKLKKEKELLVGIDLIPVTYCTTEIYYKPKTREYIGMVTINNPKKNLHIFLKEDGRSFE